MKHKALQHTFNMNVPVRAKVRRESNKIKRSKIKMPLNEAQITWGIGHNLTWIMGMVEEG
jgi:hypothetical protein